MQFLLFIRNIFSPLYYREILLEKRKFNPFLALFLISLVIVLKPAIYLATDGYVFVNSIGGQAQLLVDRIYPANLEITVESGKVKTNVEEPYYITVAPSDFKGTFLEDKKRTSTYRSRLLTIDTKARAEDFERYQSYALLTETSLIYYDDGDIKIQSLREMNDVTISKKFLQDKITEFDKNDSFGGFARGAILAAPFVLLVFIYLGQLLASAFIGLLLYVINRIVQTGATFGRMWILTVALAFLPNVVFSLLGFIPNPPQVVTALPIIIGPLILTLGYMLLLSVKPKKS